MKHFLILAATFLASLSFAADAPKHVKAEDAFKLIAAGGVVIVDVRTSDEFKDGHLKGAKNIDIMGDEFEAQLAKLDKTQPTLVHCQAGGRSMRALKVFQKLGFEKLIHLDEGFAGWEAAGKPVEK